jgi:hypothetical protein
MDKTDQAESAGAAIERELDRELAEVEAAIALVRAGSSVEVTVANLSFGEQVLQQLRLRGGDRGVRLEALPWPEDSGCDIVVRRIDA